MRVARFLSIDKPLEVGTAEQPTPNAKDVLMRVAACGLVPNTANVFRKSLPRGFILPSTPAIVGLDAAGTIDSVGAHVLGLKAGDRVYVNPFLTCGTCHQCRRGRADVCENSCLRGYFAQSEGGAKRLEHYPIGGLAEYLLSPDEKVVVLPPSISFETAARLGYIGTSYGALKKAGVGPGSTLLINGVTGTLGVAAVAIALGLGASKILGVGRNRDRLSALERLSTTEGRVVTRSSEGGDLVEWVARETGGVGVDAMYDCLGNGGDASVTSELILRATRRGGRAVLAAGGAEGQISQSYAEAMGRDVAVFGSMWFSDAELTELVKLIGAGVVDLSFLEHKRFALDEVNEALDFVGDRPGGFTNVVVVPGEQKK
ncbi:hypothetical protein JCM10450v2_003968 [Rhodotorula kratochvilovae]